MRTQNTYLGPRPSLDAKFLVQFFVLLVSPEFKHSPHLHPAYFYRMNYYSSYLPTRLPSSTSLLSSFLSRCTFLG